MRIFSTFQDYYDGVQQHGHDDHVVYERVTVETKYKRGSQHNPAPPVPGDDLLPEWFWSRPRMEYPMVDRYRRKSHTSKWGENRILTGPERAALIFCGKVYPFWIAIDDRDRMDTKQVMSFEPDFADIAEQEIRKKQRYAWWRPDASDPTPYRDWLAKYTGAEIDPAYHFLHGSPVVLYVGDTIIVNPCLKDFHLQKLIDPYTAFQEIDMFIGGVLGSIEKEGPPMTDKQKVSSHGMDPKWSFRKKPEAK